MRCATTARTPCGIVSRRPSEASSRASSATKNGWPSVRLWIEATSAAGAAVAPTARTSCPTSSGPSPPRGRSRYRPERASSATVAANPGSPAGSLLASRRDNERRRVGERIHQVPQQEQRRLVRGVEVLEHHHDGSRATDVAEQRDDGLEETEARAARDRPRMAVARPGPAPAAPARCARRLPRRRRARQREAAARSARRAGAGTAPRASTAAPHRIPSSDRRAPVRHVRRRGQQPLRRATSCRSRAPPAAPGAPRARGAAPRGQP